MISLVSLILICCDLQQVPVSKPEGRTLCTLIPGDGVGPEMMQSMQEVLEAAGAPVDFETYFLSGMQYEHLTLNYRTR